MAKVQPGNPPYPAMPSLAKFRRMAESAGGVMAMDRFARQQYGEAVEQAIRGLQRTELLGRIKAEAKPQCASGSFANTAEGIEKAVRGRIAAALASAARRDREGRSDALVQELYDQAMRIKREVAA